MREARTTGFSMTCPTFITFRSNTFRSGPVPGASRGFTLIEILIANAILVIFFGAIAMIMQNILQNIAESRIRHTALEIAQERMELIRNLPYTDVGTIGGIPQGKVTAEETVTKNSLPFTVRTSVIFVDDPYDGLSPADTVNTDYKRARVEITWGGSYPSRTPMALVTNIAPKNKETLIPGGTLIVNVFNATAQPVANAVVTISNDTVVPAVNVQVLTDENGQAVLPGAPPCSACYRISATKTNFSTDRTYGSDEVANPVINHATVTEGSVSEVSLVIDEVSYMTVESYNTSYSPVGNVIFTLKGSKIIGYDTLDNPVYKFSFTTSTGGFTVGIPNLEWDTYTLDFTTSAHTLAGSNPVLPVPLPPKSNQTLRLVTVPKAARSLHVVVKNGIGELQPAVSVRLSQPTLPYDVTKQTAATAAADYGQVFFPNLAAETYDLVASLSGYMEATASVSIQSNQQQLLFLNTL
jgi:prepilin-type N-terminal cleavage/methylation domain-containing protein